MLAIIYKQDLERARERESGGYRSREMAHRFLSSLFGLIMQTLLPRTHINFNVARGRKKTGTSASHAVFGVLIGSAVQPMPLKGRGSMGSNENFSNCRR